MINVNVKNGNRSEMMSLMHRHTDATGIEKLTQSTDSMYVYVMHVAN